MKNLTNFKQLVNAMILAVAPMTIISIGRYIIGDDMLTITNIVLTIVAYLISGVCIFLINKLISNIKHFRQHKKYEGKWIEIIPNFSRNISVCKLYFKNDSYHFDGDNYGDDINNPVHFESREFIENKNNGFFYITKSNQIPRPEGFGKVFGISNSDEGFYKANGYFVDVSTEEKPTLHKTIMIKFDSNFYDRCLNLRRDENPENFSSREIYEHVKEYAKKYYNSEVLS